jgi:hypothetical protein
MVMKIIEYKVQDHAWFPFSFRVQYWNRKELDAWLKEHFDENDYFAPGIVMHPTCKMHISFRFIEDAFAFRMRWQ